MKRRTKVDWDKIFLAFQESGQTQKAFCELHGLNYHTFSGQKQHRLKTTESGPAASDFVPLVMTDLQTGFKKASCLELCIGDLAFVRIHPDTEPRLLRTVFEALLACGRT